MIVVGDPHVPSNIVIALANNNTMSEPVALPPAMEFIVSAALEFPMWKFKVNRVHKLDSTRQYATKIQVFNERGVGVGVIGLTHHSVYANDVEFYNERISRAAQRGNSKRTGKQDVALKIIRKWFTEAPVAEQLEMAASKIHDAKTQKLNHIKNHKIQMENVVLGALRPYIMHNIESLWHQSKALQSNPSGVTLEKFKDIIEDYAIANSVVNRKCLTVVIQDGKYMIQRGKGSVEITTSDQLPEGVKRAIGMLKLIEDGQFVRDMGFRATDNMYYVVEPEEEQCKTSS